MMVRRLSPTSYLVGPRHLLLKPFCVTAIARVNSVAGGTTTVSAGAGLHGATQASDMAAAVAAAKSADAVVFVIGGDWEIEHEGMDKYFVPGDQATLVSHVRQTVGPFVPVVAVMIHGVSFSPNSFKI